MENPIKMDDLGVPLFWKHPYDITFYIGPENVGMFQFSVCTSFLEKNDWILG